MVSDCATADLAGFVTERLHALVATTAGRWPDRAAIEIAELKAVAKDAVATEEIVGDLRASTQCLTALIDGAIHTVIAIERAASNADVADAGFIAVANESVFAVKVCGARLANAANHRIADFVVRAFVGIGHRLALAGRFVTAVDRAIDGVCANNGCTCDATAGATDFGAVAEDAIVAFEVFGAAAAVPTAIAASVSTIEATVGGAIARRNGPVGKRVQPTATTRKKRCAQPEQWHQPNNTLSQSKHSSSPAWISGRGDQIPSPFLQCSDCRPKDRETLHITGHERDTSPPRVGRGFLVRGLWQSVPICVGGRK